MTRPSSEASSLKQEAHSILSSSATRVRRAAEYRPSLKEFKATPFHEYVRHTLLGVPRAHELYFNDNEEAGSVDSDNKEKLDRVITRSRKRKALEAKKLFVESPCGNKSFQLDPRFKPCPTRLRDGIAKVTLPEGWWDRKGIGNDMTARGVKWKAGTKLGDTIIRSSIKQCPSGIGGVYDFTLIENPPITVAEFRDKADKYRKLLIGEGFNKDMSDEYVDGLARKFWRRLGPTMEPSNYGADVSGSFFQGADACGWNVDKLDTCIQLLRVDLKDGEKDETYSLPGVTSAYLYFGMWASVFAAHTEDMNLLSINYLHAGSPKYWYAIAPEDSQRFESLAISHFGAAAAQCPEFLRHKRYLLSPAILRKAGISYTTQIQRPGDAIITFPGSYHFGFNTGFNVAESTNFAVPEWVPLGSLARVCMCHPHSVRIDMKRFKELLRNYEESTLHGDKRSYREWAQAMALGRKEELNREDEVGNKKTSSLQRPSYKRGIPVRLSFLSRYKDSSSKRKSPGSSGRKRSKYKEQWRLALKVRRDVFIRNTSVLCIQNCERDDDNNDDGDDDDSVQSKSFFWGKITEVVDDHVRVHFPGMLKDADVWMTRDSDNLFLDGGPEEPPMKKAKPKRLFKKSKC